MRGRIVRFAGLLICADGAVFNAAASFSELFWQADAEPKDIRKEIEDHAGNPPA